MQLTKNNLQNIIAQPGLEIPDEKLFALPEKILQFGTGVLLRGLPDHFVDKANKQGIFNGRIVIVKSTDGSNDEFAQQDGLYTICVRGVANGENVSEDIINASVSRVLAAKSDWAAILECAHNKDMKIVFSNTTEVGIQLVEENVLNGVPSSFPGKLLAFLHERFKAFNGSEESGIIIVPTELITDNGDKLKNIVLQLARFNNFDPDFIAWLKNSNTFCNSLVDRIVPGKPSGADLQEIEAKLGYTDALLTMSEPFRLWAIEGDEKVKEVLSFHAIDDAVKIVPDITLYKELKLRLLNGTHSFNCGLAYLSGFSLTREAVGDAEYSIFAKELMKQISNAIPYEIDETIKADFAKNTFERFCNPFINHQWISITVQYTSKMKMRNIPLLQRHYELNSEAPQYMATGFAAYLLFMKAVKKDGDVYYGERNGELYEIKDDSAAYFYEAWQNNEANNVAQAVLEDVSLWDTDLTQLPGFLEAVKAQLSGIINNGALQTVAGLQEAKQQ
ncbi:tagaturonate reductase [Flavobacterium sp. Sd200]|uniref:tagaturonate reductase n=1 Tax=Flavobacterium sp. Sd200 TaxID=2692211 RepID=UPI00137121FE|nr:tagaturonate reductase [Flavobacterium sp. Sd200]MXN90842.1 tagaturonate reductase [Flavobacterium sp. Sd200]